MAEGESIPGQVNTGIIKVENEKQIERSLPSRTVLTDIVEADARAHPGEWREDVPPLFGQEGRIALVPENIGVKLDVLEVGSEESITHARPTSTKSWVVNAYGSIWKEGADGGFVLATTSLARLPDLHKAIIQACLSDEHSRLSKLVAEGTQKFGIFTEEDIMLWLKTVHDGFSPIIASGKVDPDGNPIYLTHDFTDYHTLSNLLWGRKTQDRVTTAAGYELERRKKDSPPLREKQSDGVEVVDEITCNAQQIDLIDYVMHGSGNSPKERMLAAWEVVQTTGILNMNASEIPDEVSGKWTPHGNANLDPEVAGYNIYLLARKTGKLEDFIQWFEHDGARMATEEEKAQALKDALTDITRVAEKLLGIYDGSDLIFPKTDTDTKIGDDIASNDESPEPDPPPPPYIPDPNNPLW